MPSKQIKKRKDPSSPSQSQLAITKSKKASVDAVSKPPFFDLSSKGKAKAKPTPEVISLLDECDMKDAAGTSVGSQLWVDMYEPQTEAQLAVHKRKVEDVRRWFQEAFEGGPTGKLKKYRRILVLTGPAGTAKTTTVRVLAKELDLDILEWRSTMEESYQEGDYDRESLNQKFEAFLIRATSCRQLLSASNQTTTSSSRTRIPSSSSSSSNLAFGSNFGTRQIVLLEDLPNILHQPTQDVFHTVLESFVTSVQSTPLVIIISDAATRGEVRDERLAQGGGHWFSRETVDIRTVLPSSLLNGPYVTQVIFNPVAPTLMLRALQELLSRHYDESDACHSSRPSKDDLNIIVETSNGDIRSSVMALQFACVLGDTKVKAQRGKKKVNRALMEAITRREQALVLFHLMGKVLYNKRKGDPLSATTPVKDKYREQALDARLKIPPPLPQWLANDERRASRVDVDTLYAESPIDAGLFALYIHQNYPQFCDGVDQCAELSDWLSWIDSSGGEQWHQANPYRFHLLALGTLHSLPSPVTRRGQKIYKAEFFDFLKKTRDAEDAVSDVSCWLQESGSVRWSRDEIATEMGSVLKMQTRGSASGNLKDAIDPPASHSLFSAMTFSKPASQKALALDGDTDGADEGEISVEEDAPRRLEGKQLKENADGAGVLTDDDIEEF
ncbi:RAD17 [Sanghuangporus weigelae]